MQKVIKSLSPFWHRAPRHLVNGALCFETSQWSNIQGSKYQIRNGHSCTFPTLEFKTTTSPRYDWRLSLSDAVQYPDGPRLELHSCERLRNRKFNPVAYLNIKSVSSFGICAKCLLRHVNLKEIGLTDGSFSI